MATIRTDSAHYTAIAEAIREKNGESTTYKPSEMAAAIKAVETGGGYTQEDIDQAYEVGGDDMLRIMWETIQSGGARTNYTNLLNHTNFSRKTFKPIYDIKLTGTEAYNWMQNCPIDKNILLTDGQVNMKELEEEQGMTFDFAGCTNLTKAFSGGLFSELNVIDVTSATNLLYTFYGGYLGGDGGLRLKKIERLICSPTTKFDTTTFQYATELTHIGFEGEIASSINLQWSTKLSKESIISVINALSPETSGLSVSLSKTAVNNAFVGDVYGENLLPYPYESTTQNYSGFQITDNGDGSLTVNGTAPPAISFCFNRNLVLPAGTYKLSGYNLGEGKGRIELLTTSSPRVIATDQGDGAEFVLTKESAADVTLYIYTDKNFDNITMIPKIQRVESEWEALENTKRNWEISLV